MYNDNIRKLSCMVLVIGTILGLTGCSTISSKPIQKEEIIAPNVDDIATEYDIDYSDFRVIPINCVYGKLPGLYTQIYRNNF